MGGPRLEPAVVYGRVWMEHGPLAVANRKQVQRKYRERANTKVANHNLTRPASHTTTQHGNEGGDIRKATARGPMWEAPPHSKNKGEWL